MSKSIFEEVPYEPRKRYTFTITESDRELLSKITKSLKGKSDSETLSKLIQSAGEEIEKKEQ